MVTNFKLFDHLSYSRISDKNYREVQIFFRDNPNDIFVEFITGARKGTIAKWIIDRNDMFSEPFSNMAYGKCYTLKINCLTFEVEGKLISLPLKNAYKKIKVSDRTITKNIFTKKETVKSTIPKHLDHFGKEISIGDRVLFVKSCRTNHSLRFGIIERFTEKGSIFVKMLRSQSRHSFKEKSEYNNVTGNNIIIIGDDLFKDEIVFNLLKE